MEPYYFQFLKRAAPLGHILIFIKVLFSSLEIVFLQVDEPAGRQNVAAPLKRPRVNNCLRLIKIFEKGSLSITQQENSVRGLLNIQVQLK